MSEVASQLPEKESKHSLLNWARRHPAATALGVFVFAALCLLPFSPKRPLADLPSAEQSSDEAPLFI
jgi:hypothetical protein